MESYRHIREDEECGDNKYEEIIPDAKEKNARGVYLHPALGNRTGFPFCDPHCGVFPVFLPVRIGAGRWRSGASVGGADTLSAGAFGGSGLYAQTAAGFSQYADRGADYSGVQYLCGYAAQPEIPRSCGRAMYLFPAADAILHGAARHHSGRNQCQLFGYRFSLHGQQRFHRGYRFEDGSISRNSLFFDRNHRSDF